MSRLDLDTKINRRGALALGGGLAAGGLFSAPSAAAAKATTKMDPTRHQHGKLPVKQIEQIVQAQGTVSSGILDIPISRSDLSASGPLGVTQDGAFELQGNITFQPLGDHQAFLNADQPLLASETQPFITALFANGLTFEAFHMHYIALDPQIWFVHYRGTGRPLALARAAHAALKATATPRPQMTPSNPKTPLNPKRLGHILHGMASVGEEGVVTVNVSRPPVHIQGVVVEPGANIETTVMIKPLNASGSMAAVAPDFSLQGKQVQPVTQLMNRNGWFIGCLYNQETQEHPQLFFSHMIKVGDPYALAIEVRAGLNLTNSE
jgi:hypothetical protein